MRRMLRYLASAVFGLSVLVSTSAMAQIPRGISYQGWAFNEQGQVPDGTYSINCRIYDSPNASSPIWSESQTVVITSGLFNVELGRLVPLALPFDKPYYLGFEIQGQPEFSPRTRMLTVPYAFMSETVPNRSLEPIKFSAQGARAGQALVATDTGVVWRNVVNRIFSTPQIVPNPQAGTGELRLNVVLGSIQDIHLAEGAVTPGKLNTTGLPREGQYLAYSAANGGGMRWVTPQLTPFQLPFADTVATTTPSFHIANTENASVARFALNAPVSNSPALLVENIGSGPSLQSTNSGNGRSALFTNTATANASATVRAENSGTGQAIDAQQLSANGRVTAVLGRVVSNADSVSGVLGRVDIAASGPFSAGLRGVNSGTGAGGFGVWGSHAGRGRGVFGASVQGVGVMGTSRDSFAVVAQRSLATGTTPALLAESASASDSASVIVGRFSGNVGVNSTPIRGHIATGPNGVGVWGSHGASGTGVFGSSETGAGVRGNSVDSIGVIGQHSANRGVSPGVFGSTNSGDSLASAVLGQVQSATAGPLSSGVRGVTNSSNSRAVAVLGQNSGTGTAILGISSRSVGVQGLSRGGAQESIGVLGVSESTGGTAVRARSTLEQGLNYGVNSSVASDSGIAVLATAPNATSAYAGYFNGAVTVSGDLRKTFGGGSETERRIAPVAFGSIAASGQILSGTPNFSVSWDSGAQYYVITLTGVNYNTNDFVVTVSPVGIAAPLIPVTGSLQSGVLLVRIFNLASASVQNGFHFMVHRP